MPNNRVSIVDTTYQDAVTELAKLLEACYEERGYRHFLKILEADILREVGNIKVEKLERGEI